MLSGVCLMRSRRQMLLSSLGALAAPALVARAQDVWPLRDIHAICMFPAGSGADIYVRYFARKLQEMVGKTVLVENKVGAFGNIATEYVARSKPDGYTIYIAPSNLLAIAPHLYSKLSYDPMNDFEHVTTLFKLPFILIVAADSPFKNVPDLVGYLKQKGDRASYASVSTVSLVSAELFKAQFELSTVEVKYKESSAALADLWGGNVAFLYLDPAGTAAHIAAGKLRPLAVTTAQRVQALKNIPGSSEVGIMNSDLFSWWSVHTPRGVPKPILDKLEWVFNQIVGEQDTRAFLANTGSDVLPGNAKLARELLAKGLKDWGGYVKLARIEPLS